MPPVRTPALVLHSFPYGDTSRILRILTPELGLRSVIAKGARRPRSRFGAILEPFTEGEAQFNLREGVELLTLSGFTLIRSRQGIGHNLAAFTGASLLAEVTLRFGTEEGSDVLYNLLGAALDRLAVAGLPGTATTLQALWGLISIMGYQPRMTSCVRCDVPIGPSESTGFDAQAGGAVCGHCRPGGRLPAAVRHEIDAMTQAVDWELMPSNPALHADLLEAFLALHLPTDRGLRAFPLFRAQLHP